MDAQEKFDEAQKLKDEGNNFFKAGKYSEAKK